MLIKTMSRHGFFWAWQGICALHRKPFALHLAQQQQAAPYTTASLARALCASGFDVEAGVVPPHELVRGRFPLLVWLSTGNDAGEAVRMQAAAAADTEQECDAGAEHVAADGVLEVSPGFILQADSERVLIAEPDAAAPRMMALSELARRYAGDALHIVPGFEAAIDPDSAAGAARPFGFHWFIPELRKHHRLWRDIILASLVIQLIALATPLFTQVIIDKVVVHRTESTLLVIVTGMIVLILFSSLLSWLRQYLVLHTGNRVDAVLGAAVCAHLFKLPPLYFQHRPTGVVAARLEGVETIREFIASAAVTLILDCPFLLIFVGIMFYYSVTLTLLVLAILALIVVLSLVVAPMFQQRLQEEFLLGARNQAFLTEYIAGMETVKSLQLEPQLDSKYSGYLASYLQAGFATRQLSNTYNTVAGLLEQLMNLLILGCGAWIVMQAPEFTIGMLVAFQMFASRLSQPMLRLVGLWQQFQQASLSVARLGDLMNAPPEPYSVIPARDAARKGEIRIEQVAFRYHPQQPLLYRELSLTIAAGQMTVITGPSGCGKSTLTKLLQGFYQPVSGRIVINGVDIRYLAANELRSNFGVVPQETILFSGSVYDNLQLASPHATFEQIVIACRMAEVHDVIEAMPQGYRTEIGERGAGMSGGQKQRLAIARALLKQPGILIFDEATSALDDDTAASFARTVNSLKGRVTMLFITHCLPAGLQPDVVIRLSAQGAQEIPAPV
ncbi:peptidase domain-containing ABC transporter [Herbaspirillum autotrophicum]|uniref:peptidase domain-containing ABC transporter n=1 Tax=Herbaspirillum autotrophicum TaxID=180195 RepID=UPI0009F8F27E|nr:peptidase domain-containing ABC transporter [Herbaspirillum autotrophicum]